MIHATKIDMNSLMLLLKSLLFLSAVTQAIDETSGNNNRLTDKRRLTDDVIPLKYDLSLELHDTYRNTSSRGVCRILVLIKRPTRNISFHADRSQIQELTVNLLKHEDKLQRYRPTSNSYDVETDIYTFFFAVKLSGYYIVYLMFGNVEDNNKGSFFRTSFINNDGDRTWVVATDLWPMGARRLFPCFDEPIFQANFSILIKHPKSYKILSNMPKQKTSITEQSDMIWTHFEDTPPIPTYQVSAILLSSFSSTTNITDVHIEHRKQLNYYYINFTLSVLDKITQYFKSQKMYLQNLNQLSHVAIPGFRHDALSNLGLISYRETAIIFDEKKDPPMRQIDIARLLGHAVAYQCLSNRNGSSSWSYIWLNQGISTLLAMDAIDQIYPNYHIKDLFVVQTLQESLRLDTDSIMKPLISKVNGPSDIDSGFSFACYIKAPAILRMLQYILGEKVFQNGINKYLNNDPSYGMEDIKAFWISMQAAYDEQDVMYLNLKETMEAWMTREHYPVMNVTQNKTHFIVTTENSTKESEKEWWIPYIAMVMEESNFPLSKSMRYVSMSIGHSVHVSEDWLIVNLQQIGYYRVNYNAESLKRIANYLNTDKYFKVHVLNRAQIIDDAFHFLIRGQLNLSVFVDLTMYLLIERSYIAWYPMFKAFEYMSSFFPFEESSYIKSKMIRILDKLHQKIGYEEKSDLVHFNSSLKQEAARWACVFGSSECKKKAYFKLKAHLDHQISLLPWLKEWTYCYGLMAANNNTWNKVFEKYIEELDYILLKCLACSENFSIIRKYLELITSKHYDEKIKDYERIYIFNFIIARYAKNDSTLDYILENFDKVKPREISITVMLTNIINHVYSQSSLDKINTFLKDYFITWPTGLFKHPLVDDRLYNKITRCTSGDISDLIIYGKMLCFKHKIELRSSEIMRHMNHFRSFYS